MLNMSVLYCDISTCSPFFLYCVILMSHDSWLGFICLTAAHWMVPARQSGRERPWAPPRGTNQTHLKLRPGYGLWNPGKPGQVLLCTALSVRCDAIHSHCCLRVFQVTPAYLPAYRLHCEEQETEEVTWLLHMTGTKVTFTVHWLSWLFEED